MCAAIALWSQIVAPGDEPTVVAPVCDLRITNVALGDELEDSTGRATLKLTHMSTRHENNDGDDSEDEGEGEESKEDTGEPEVSTVVITSLTPGKIEQSSIDITLLADEEYLFEVVGKNSFHLTGNYLAAPDDEDDEGRFFGDDSEDEDDEGAYDLREVSSDVEIDPADVESDASRFEDVEEDTPKEAAKSAKRPRESDAMDTDEVKPSKADKKKNKKLKAENGAAVATGAGDQAEDVEKKSEKKEKKKDKKDKKKDKAEFKELQGGLKYQDAKVGTGPIAKTGNRLKMRYIGKLQNGKIFDQNTKGSPFSFRLGQGDVIKGWDQGLAGMQAGGERVLVIPPQLAYGKKGSGAIPPNSTLTFECKLLEIK